MISRFLKRVAGLSWYLPSFLLWASFPPIGEKTDVLFALAPIMWFARNNQPRRSFKIWFFNGLLFWFATLAWMPAIIKNGGPWYLVFLGWGILSVYCAAFFGAFGFLSSCIWQNAKTSYLKRLFAILIAEPILWAGLELLRSRLFGGFAWNQLGVIPVNAGFGACTAVGGVFLASAVVVLINGTFVSIAERMLAPYFAQRRRKVVLDGVKMQLEPLPEQRNSSISVSPYLRCMETVLPVLLSWGLHLTGNCFLESDNRRNCRELTFALVQRNFPCAFQEIEKNPTAVYDKLLTGVSLFSPDIVVLPESAFCEYGPFGSAYAERFSSWILERTGAKSVIGGGTRVECGKLYNSAALYSVRSGPVRALDMQYYDKVHLVPFGEYIPGDDLIPALKNLAPVGSCSPGEPKLLTYGDVKIAVAICYEDTDSELIRSLASMGADVLVFITNDSWFSYSDEAVQHAWQSVARAIETGLPVVRVGNSGVTGVISSRGEARWLSRKDGTALIDSPGCKIERLSISKEKKKTLYMRVGDWPLWLLFFATATVALIPGIKPIKMEPS